MAALPVWSTFILALQYSEPVYWLKESIGNKVKGHSLVDTI